VELIMRRQGLSWVVVGLVAALFAAYVGYPLAVMIAESMKSAEGWTAQRYLSLLTLSDPANLEAVWNSVLVSLLSVLFSGLVGLLLAFGTTQIDFRFRTFASRLAVLPIALPPLVGVIAFLFVYGESGILPRALQWLVGLASPPLFLDGVPAILAIHVYSFNVYFYLLCADALRTIDGSTVEAAESLRASSWTIIRRVMLPHLRPAIIAASVLTFMTSMASFSAPLLFGGGRRFITLQIYTTKLNGEIDLAAAQSVLLAAVSVGFFVLLTLAGRERYGQRQAKGTGRVRSLRFGRFARLILLAGVMLVLLFELLPVAALALISFVRDGSWTSQILPSVFTVDNYLALIQDSSVLEPFVNSLLMGLLAVAGSIIVGGSAAFLLTKGVLRRGRLVGDMVLTVPYAIPGTVLAIALILAFNRPILPSGFEVLVGTFWILPLAYWIRTYPLVLRSTSASLDRLDDSLLEASASLGAGGWYAFRRVVVPLILPGIISGALLAMISAMGEFVSSILLYTYSSRPVSVEILAQLRSFNFGSASAYAVVLLLVVVAILAIAGRFGAQPRAEDAPVGI
jgi:iron(III) transport system permease protein